MRAFIILLLQLSTIYYVNSKTKRSLDTTPLYQQNKECMEKANPENVSVCTSISVASGFRCCYVYFEMKDEDLNLDYSYGYKRCHAIQFEEDKIKKFDESMEDFDVYKILCSASYIKRTLLFFILLFII